MELDDRRRGEKAVGVSLRETAAGKLRISLDDLERAEGEGPPEWRMWSFYTHFDLTKDQVLDQGLTDQEYTRIGQILMARLAALWRRGQD